MRSQRSIDAERAKHERKPASRRAKTSTASTSRATTDSAAKKARRASAEPKPPIKLDAIQVRDGVVSLNGYGVRIAVEKGHLTLADGIGSHRRAGRFSRATCGIKRLVVRGSAFFITGDALAWLTEIGASFLNLGFDGEILAAWSPPGHDDARLRRAQAIAPFTDTGLSLTKYLLREKILGQLHNLERSFPSDATAIRTVRTYLDALDVASDPQAIRVAEAKAADAYWRAWENVAVSFIRKDAGKIPEHWRTFGSRLSAVTETPNRASNPANALFNYLYAILEAEARIACQTVGLDPGLGLFHTDKQKRDSLALDVMEPVRPAVDAYIHALLKERVWTWDDFAEIRDGVCRVLPSLTHALAETATAWAKATAPYVEHVAHTLHDTMDALSLPSGMNGRFVDARSGASKRPFATRLTNANRQRKPPSAAKPVTPRLRIESACRNCGVILEGTDRRYCDDCLPDFKTEHAQVFQRAGMERVRQMREAGDNIQQRPEVKARKRERMQEIRAAMKAWESEHGQPSEQMAAFFREQVIPRLHSVTQGCIAEATGLSKDSAWAVRNGRRVPHPMHWDALAKLAGVELQPLERD